MLKLWTGALVVYRGKSAQIVSVNSEKIDIRVEGGTSKSVREKDIEFLHSGPVTSLPPQQLPPPDFEEIMELMEEETFSFADFAELLYSANSASAFWSAYQNLQDGLYFTGSLTDGVKARPIQEVKDALASIQAKAEAKEKRAALLSRIQKNELLPEDLPCMAEIEQVAYGQNENSRLMRDLEMEATPEKAHQLLIRLGVWSELVNPYPRRAGITMEQPSAPLPSPPPEVREDFTGMTAYAIDNEGSEDPDDAISFADGLLWVHVADPASVVTPDSELNSICKSSGANLYLPEKIVTMLPPEATPIFGLGLQEISPAFSFGIKITDDGDAVLEKMALANVKVKRLTYAGAAVHMQDSPLKEISEALERFRIRRENNGALFIRLPEADIHLKDGKVVITPVEITPERELVANAMLAAGAAVGRFAVEHDIPMPFATQSEIGEKAASDSLPDMFALRRQCPPSVVRTSPDLHAGLGLNPYVRLTSPLRRYVDLLAHQQLRRFLAGEELMSAEELENNFLTSEKEALLRRKLERQCDDFWMQVFFRQNPEWSGEAVLVNQMDDRLTFLIPTLAYEFKSRWGGKINLGDTVRASIRNSDPTTLSAQFKLERQ